MTVKKHWKYNLACSTLHSGHPASGSSVVGSQPSLHGSQDLSDNDMATINPGYVPDQEAELEEQTGPDSEVEGDNPAFVPDDGEKL